MVPHEQPRDIESVLPKQKEWDQHYKSQIELWGAVPSSQMVYALQHGVPGIALDIGAGEGRNAMFLLNSGYEVEAVDLSKTALIRLKAKAASIGRDVHAEVADFREFVIQPQRYSLIVADSVLNFVTIEEQDDIIKRSVKGLCPGGILCIIAFSKEEFYNGHTSGCVPFNEEILRQSTTDLELIQLSHSIELDESHGIPHYHYLLSYIGRKKEQFP